MIMRRGQPLLLPANPLFIWGSLLGAFGLDMLLNMGWGGRAAWAPDFLALTLVFWSIHQPLRVGVGAAFVFGLFMDVHQVSLLGQHALAYTVLSYYAISMHRRLLWFSVPAQALQVLPMFAVAQAVEVLIRLAFGGQAPGWSVLLSPLLETLLWPVASLLLLAPQRRPPDPDKNRPL